MVTLFLAGSPPALVVDEFGAIAMVVEQDQRRLRRAAEFIGEALRFEPVHEKQSETARV